MYVYMYYIRMLTRVYNVLKMKFSKNNDLCNLEIVSVDIDRIKVFFLISTLKTIANDR